MNKTLNNIFKGDKVIWMVFLFLCIISVIEVYSASSQLTYNSNYMAPVLKHVGLLILGLFCMIVTMNIPCRYFKVALPFLLAFSIATLVGVFFMGAVNDGHRWFKIMGIQFQPSEIAKFTLILVSAVIFDAYHRDMFSNKMSRGRFARMVDIKYRRFIKESSFPTIAVVLLTGMFAALIYMENHLSGAVIIFLIGCVMMFLGGVRDRWFIIGVVGVLGAAALVCYIVMSTRDSGSGGILQKYMGNRIIGWLDKDYEPTGARWQTNQSLYAIGSGGFFGTGLGGSTQKYMYVSEPQNDFIFAIVCEETGFFGAMMLLLLFTLLVWRGIVIGTTAKNRFGGLLAMGIVLQVGIQVILNIAVATDSIPNTGISLPFFSYGGTSLVIFMVQMGMVLSVSRSSRNKKSLNE